MFCFLFFVLVGFVVLLWPANDMLHPVDNVVFLMCLMCNVWTSVPVVRVCVLLFLVFGDVLSMKHADTDTRSAMKTLHRCHVRQQAW